MKSFNVNKRRKLVFLALLIIAGVALAMLLTNRNSKNDVADSDQPTVEQLEQASSADSENKKEFIENTATDPGNDEPKDQSTRVDITLSAKQEADQTVTITSKLPGVSSGTCRLTITNGSKSINKTAGVIYQSEFSSCAGFSVPISELGSGIWNVQLNVEGTKSGSQTTTIRVD